MWQIASLTDECAQLVRSSVYSILLIAVLASVVVHDIPETLGATATVAAEEDRITRSGSGAASRQA